MADTCTLEEYKACMAADTATPIKPLLDATQAIISSVQTIDGSNILGAMGADVGAITSMAGKAEEVERSIVEGVKARRDRRSTRRPEFQYGGRRIQRGGKDYVTTDSVLVKAIAAGVI